MFNTSTTPQTILCRSFTLIAIAFLFITTPVAATQDTDIEKSDRDIAFEKLLHNVQLVGHFTQSTPPTITPLQQADEDDQPLKEDRYTIRSVTKLREGVFQFDAIVHYGERDFPIKMNLPIKWAGDTPMIALSNMMVPGMGTFDATIIFDGNKYAGTWAGTDHGGHLFGYIVQAQGADIEPPATHRDDTLAPLHWPTFRGNHASGIATTNHSTVTEWNVETGHNIQWSTPVPGLAHSSPIIAGDRIFITSAVTADETADDAELTVGLYGSIMPVDDEGQQHFTLYCIDRNTGDILWQRIAITAVPDIQRHPKGSHAASTPATDGQHVVAFFGSEGLYCYDIDGNLKWEKNFGSLDSGYYMVPDAQWGFASSPIIHNNAIIIQCDVQGDSFLASLDINTGKTNWKTNRDEVPTWGSPTIATVNDKTQIILNGYKHIGGYDFDTGKELWTITGGGDIPVPTPIISTNNIAYITNAHGRLAPIYAIDLNNATGQLQATSDDTSVLWYQPRRGNYMQTPIIHDDLLYLCHDTGVLSVYNATTGEQLYRNRLGSGQTGFTASPILADDKLYFPAEDGEVYVIKLGREFQQLTVNTLGETCMATPATAEGTLYFRTRSHLIAIGES